MLTMLISQVSGTEFFTAVFEWHDEEELVPAVRGVCLRWSILITINSSLVFSVPEGNDGDHDDQWRWLQWIKMSSQGLFFQGGDILRLWKERCGRGSNCGFSRTKQGAAKKKSETICLNIPSDAYPFSDPPPLADHGNVLAWRADPQGNHWRHRCHQLIINTTKKIDFTIIVKNILKNLQQSYNQLPSAAFLMKPLSRSEARTSREVLWEAEDEEVSPPRAAGKLLR